MTSYYKSGALVRETGRFFDVTGAPADPTAITLKYRVGTGSTQTLTYAGGQVTRDSTGVYYHDFDTTGWAGPGYEEWTLEWFGTGSVQAVSEPDSFRVNPPAL